MKKLILLLLLLLPALVIATPSVTDLTLSGCKASGLVTSYSVTDSLREVLDYRIAGVSVYSYYLPALNNATAFNDYTTYNHTPTIPSNIQFMPSGGPDGYGSLTTTGGSNTKMGTGYLQNENSGYNWAFSFWMKYHGQVGTPYNNVIGYGTGAGWRLERSGSTTYWYCYDDYVGGFEVTGINLSYDTWHHIIAGADSSNFFCWVDGVKITGAVRGNVNRNQEIFLFDIAFNRAFNGEIAQAIFFNRNITDSEAAMLYARDYKNYPKEVPTVGDTWSVVVSASNLTAVSTPVLSNLFTVPTSCATATPIPVYKPVPTPEIVLSLKVVSVNTDSIVITIHKEKWTSEYTLMVNGTPTVIQAPYTLHHDWITWVVPNTGNLQLSVKAKHQGGWVYSKTVYSTQK